MKKLLFCLALAGCGGGPSNSYLDDRFIQQSRPLDMLTLITDRKTGCEFLSAYKGGMVLIPGSCTVKGEAP